MSIGPDAVLVSDTRVDEEHVEREARRQADDDTHPSGRFATDRRTEDGPRIAGGTGCKPQQGPI